MPQSCVVVGCANRHTTGTALQFFSFPLKNEIKLKKWIHAMRRENWTPTKYSRICSEHFIPSDYAGLGMNVPYLKESAVPSVFKAFSTPTIGKKRTLEVPNVEPLQKNDQLELDSNEPTTSKILRMKPSPKTFRLRKKIKALKQKVRRRDRKVHSLQDLVKVLKNKGLLERNPSTIIENHFDGTLGDIFKNELMNRNRRITGRRYSKEVKHFALTMLYYSPKAYRFCRSILSLPHPTSVRNWTSSVNAEPGFLSNVFAELSKLPLEDKNCNLIIDGMEIRKQIIWEPKIHKFTGYCDFGNEVRIEGAETPACEALVFMLVGLNGKWKWPIGYFFTARVNSTVQAELIKTALILASDAGLKTWGVTCDGTTTNYDTLHQLGCDLFKENYNDIKHYFKHPTKNYKVYFVPDACHNLKLARNALGTYGSFISPNGEIKWTYLEHLANLQTKVSLKLANKLGPTHIQWAKNAMNVKLAAQTFSSSVADALDFLQTLGLEEFFDCEETIHFIRVIDRIFDFLNSRDPFAKGYKSPLYANNISYLESTMVDQINYLFLLKDRSGKLLCQSGRKTFLLGLATAVKSIFDIAKSIFSAPNTQFKYILTYKFSQDHIELLFGRIRQRFGSNNNPNVQQFRTAMKQILVKNSISASASANCVALDSDSIGSVFELKWNKRSSPLLSDDLSEPESDTRNTFGQQMLLHFLSPNLKEVKENVLFYICGYVVRKIVGYINCANCANMLMKEPSEHNYAHAWRHTRFLDTINRGGLVSASASVFKIVSEAEKQFILITNNAVNLNQVNLDRIILNKLINRFALDSTIFSNRNQCTFTEIGFEVPHNIQLIKSVAKRYLKIRLLSFGKYCTNEIIKPVSKRHQLSKLILFNSE